MNAAHTYSQEKRIVTGISLLIGFLALLYGGLLFASVVNVVVRTETEKNIAVAHSRISELESEYLERTNTITRSFAETLGFKDAAYKTYIVRGESADTLSLNQ